MTASSVPTLTVSPSGTLIETTFPPTGEGTSVSTLSVEISNRGSSRSIVSPSFFSHLVMVPSTTVSPSCGMVTGVANVKPPSVGLPLGEPVYCVHDVLNLGNEGVFQRGAERNGDVRRGQPDHRRVEQLEAVLRDNRGDLGPDAECPVALVQHD